MTKSTAAQLRAPVGELELGRERLPRSHWGDLRLHRLYSPPHLRASRPPRKEHPMTNTTSAARFAPVSSWNWGVNGSPLSA